MSSKSLGLALLATASLLLALPSAAQNPAPSVADPLDAQAKLPVLRYQSAFASYQADTDLSVGSWLQANERVNRIGGWRSYARQAQQAEIAPPQPASHAKPMHDMPHGHGHGHHKMK